MKKLGDICPCCNKTIEASDLVAPFVQQGLSYDLFCATHTCNATYSFKRIYKGGDYELDKKRAFAEFTGEPSV